jgi:hypothetical protein
LKKRCRGVRLQERSIHDSKFRKFVCRIGKKILKKSAKTENKMTESKNAVRLGTLATVDFSAARGQPTFSLFPAKSKFCISGRFMKNVFFP